MLILILFLYHLFLHLFLHPFIIFNHYYLFKNLVFFCTDYRLITMLKNLKYWGNTAKFKTTPPEYVVRQMYLYSVFNRQDSCIYIRFLWLSDFNIYFVVNWYTLLIITVHLKIRFCASCYLNIAQFCLTDTNICHI